MAGMTCQCGSLAIGVCPSCKDSPLCEECKREYGACEDCADTGDGDHDDPFGLDDEDDEDDESEDDEDDA